MARIKKQQDVTWSYEGRTKNGDLVTGTVEAPTAIIARVKLRKREIIPLLVKQKGSFSFLGDALSQSRGRVGSQEKKT